MDLRKRRTPTGPASTLGDSFKSLILTGFPAGPTVFANKQKSRGAMTTGTLTRADLTEAVFQAVGLSRTDSAQMVEDMLEEVCGALAKGETVKLSSFGTFAVRQK